MLVLPIPLIASLMLAGLLVFALLRGGVQRLFLVLLAVAAAQGAVVSMTQYYGIAWLQPVQAVMAAAIPPLAWISFQSTAVRKLEWRRDILHGAAPLLAAMALFAATDALDIIVSAAFLGYGAAILVSLRGGADGLPLTRLEAGQGPGLVWGGIATGLIVSALSDVMIVAAIATGHEGLRPVIISVFSALTLGLFGALIMSQSLSGDEQEAPAPPLAPIDEVRAGEIMARLDTLMAGERLYLNADLTLERLSRRLLVPAKQLSTAINRATGENVSRYVNALRIDHACGLLLEGRNVTEVMLSSGFNTKSNFNREFLRLKGSPPSQWLALHKSATLV